uniref:Uncharacterized protein n=1 Tax=Heterorhabditis bacteriophora TaxID=37862 RepID=A0A1I7WFA7_HETBA
MIISFSVNIDVYVYRRITSWNTRFIWVE